MLIGITSCDSSQSAIKDLEVLLNEIEENHQTYTDEDWETIFITYSVIEEKLAMYEYTGEDLKEISRLRGKYVGYLTKHSLKDLEKQVNEIPKQIEGAMEGFMEVLSK
jgi:hypothetical protein